VIEVQALTKVFGDPPSDKAVKVFLAFGAWAFSKIQV
jgi:hypothetical protein